MEWVDEMYAKVLNKLEKKNMGEQERRMLVKRREMLEERRERMEKEGEEDVKKVRSEFVVVGFVECMRHDFEFVLLT